MSTNFPGGIDTTGPSGSLPVETAATPLSNNHVAAHQNVSDAVIAVQTYLGIIGSAVTSSITYLLTNVLSIDPGHKHTKNSVTLALDDLSDVIITTPVNGNGLTYNGTNWVNSSTATADASTTVKGVTKVSVAPASASNPISVGVNNSNSGTVISGTNNVEDVADTSATSSASKLARQDANGKIALGMTYFDYQAFTSSGTWTKPTGLTGNELVHIKVWGDGGGGGPSSVSGAAGGGGGGGGYAEAFVRAGDLGSTVTVTVGTGGTSGNAGSGTTFGTSLSALGGSAGIAGSGGPTQGPGGAGASSIFAISAAGGPVNSPGTAGSTSINYGGAGGGGGSTGSNGGPGGAASAMWGGAGGGGGSTSATGGAGGAAGIIGGAGGAGANGTTNNGSNGGIFAGGGGAVSAGAAKTGGTGGRGECRVWILI